MRYTNTEDFMKELMQLNSENALIFINHKLYGEQKLQCALNLINDSRIGFTVGGGCIFINKNEIELMCCNNNQYVFRSNLMEIKIVK